jgi:hypothetical protein
MGFFFWGLTEEKLQKKKIWVEILELCEGNLKSVWDVEEVKGKRRLLRRRMFARRCSRGGER